MMDQVSRDRLLRKVGILLVIVGLLAVVPFWWMWVASLLGFAPASRVFVAVVVAIGAGALALGMVLTVKATVRLSRSLDPLACPHCGYDLQGDIETKRCPECGDSV